MNEFKMKAQQKIGAIIIFSIILVTGIFWFLPEQPLKSGMLIFTAVPSDINLADHDLGIDGKYISQAKIISLEVHRHKKNVFLLSEGFYSARSPEVSYDGREMVFSGQRKGNDTWQIFVKNLETFEMKQITDCPVNCTDPAWLPDGRIVFSRLNEENKVGQLHVLYACDPDGSHMERLMFHPNSAVSSSVFQDGRILVVSEQKYPATRKKQLLTLRSDGTKSELYFESENKSIPASRGWESTDGKLYFVEKSADNMKIGWLVSVEHGHPLSSQKELSAEDQGNFHSLYPKSASQLLVSYQKAGRSTFGLYLFDIPSKKVTEEIYLNDEYHLIEPVIIRKRERPMRLPSIVDLTKEKGTLLCHNTDLSTIPVNGETDEEVKTDKVQVLGMDGLMGEVSVEKDGSFYIEIDADIPVRFQTINTAGEILRGPSGWVWVRPNEKRSCIGCHEDRELAPENKVPLALYSGMVSLPEGKKSEPIVLSEKLRKR